MAVQDLTNEQIECRMNLAEKKIAEAVAGHDTEELKFWNGIFQKLLDEQVRRDIDGEE